MQQRAGLRMLKLLLVAALSVALSGVNARAQAPQLDLQRGLENYKAVMAGSKQYGQLSAPEKNEIAAIARVMRRNNPPKNTSECRSAWSEARDAADEVSSAASALKSCVDAGDYSEDCSGRFGRVRSAYNDYESAVSDVTSYCQ